MHIKGFPPSFANNIIKGEWVMGRDWMDSYVSKVSKKSFDIENVCEVIGKLIGDLNEKLLANGQPSTKYYKEKNVIKFPDCAIIFKEDGYNLTFVKEFESGNKHRVGVMIRDKWTHYDLVTDGNMQLGNYDEIGEAIIGALSFLLITSSG
jgi:hypothetical protein